MTQEQNGFTLVERSAMRMGFTLVELLVVITIIVVLLALLTPALDKAIYQAELAVCGATVKTIATGSLTYAVDNRRSYPKRFHEPGWEAIRLRDHNYDYRQAIDDYVAVTAFNDPLSGGISFDDASNSNGSEAFPTILFSNYQVYGGWQFTTNQGMRRLGDRFEWEGRRFAVLAGDRDSRFVGQWAIASHPDDRGRMRLVTYQDQDSPWEAQSFLGAPAMFHVTLSWWQLDNTIDRGLIDTNFALDDGSVRRFSTVDADDERMRETPEYAGANAYDQGRFIQLPPSD